MRLNPIYAPDGMAGASRSAEHFDDGLVHNHHWAVTADEAYPSVGPRSTIARDDQPIATFQSHGYLPQDDRHDDGLVHNHDWAVSGS